MDVPKGLLPCLQEHFKRYCRILIASSKTIIFNITEAFSGLPPVCRPSDGTWVQTANQKITLAMIKILSCQFSSDAKPLALSPSPFFHWSNHTTIQKYW